MLKKKALIVSIAVLLLVTCMFLPAGASWGGISQSVYTYDGVNTILYGGSSHTAVTDYPDTPGIYTWTNIGQAGKYVTWVIPFSAVLNSGDTLLVSGSWSGFCHRTLAGLDVAYNTTNGSVHTTSILQTYKPTTGGTGQWYTFNLQIQKQFLQAVTVDSIQLRLRFADSPFDGGILSLDNNKLTFGGGNYGEYQQQQKTQDTLDEIASQPEKEKQEANDTGNSAASDVSGAIPADISSVTAGIQSFVQSMAYDGVSAKWTFPALYLPAIPGLMERVELTTEQDIDFGVWVQRIPSGVLEIVQIVSTIALVLFCFKELYGMINYFLTLKGGGSDE